MENFINRLKIKFETITDTFDDEFIKDVSKIFNDMRAYEKNRKIKWFEMEFMPIILNRLDKTDNLIKNLIDVNETPILTEEESIYIKSLFINDEKGFIPSKVLYEIVKEKYDKITPHRLKKYMIERLGIRYGIKIFNGKNTRGYFKITLLN